MSRRDFRKTLLIFGVVHVLLFLVLFWPLAHYFYHGTGSLELYIARQMLGGQIPYHDFTSEYPPLALLSFLLPGLVFNTAGPYSGLFAAEMLIFDLLIILMIIDLASFFKAPVKTILAVYTLIIFATGPILVCRYDILPAMLVMAALWAFIKGKNKLAWAATALGFAAKVYPVIIIPLFIVYQLKNRQYSQLIKGGAVFLAVLLVFSLPWIVIDAPGYGESWTYHMERGLHSESTYGTVLLSGQVLGLTSVTGDLNFGSWNLSSPLADSLAGISWYVSAGFLVIVYGLFAWRLRKESREDLGTIMSESGAVKLLQYAALAVIVFMLTNKVFSAQYLIWLCPLLPLITGRKGLLIMGLFIAAALLTQYVYPYNYSGFELGHAVPVFVLTLRNLLLIVAAILIALCNSTKTERYQIPGTRALRSGG